MFKKILIAIISTLIMISIMATGNYVTIIYKVSQPAGTYPNSLYATAQITYDAYQKPVHTTSPVPAVWDKKTGEASWTLPIGCYVKFICNATGLDGTYQIPNANAYLNDLIPVQPPPEPSWTANYVPYVNATANVNLGDYNLTANYGTFSQGATLGNTHITADTSAGSKSLYFDFGETQPDLVQAMVLKAVNNPGYGSGLRIDPYAGDYRPLLFTAKGKFVGSGVVLQDQAGGQFAEEPCFISNLDDSFPSAFSFKATEEVNSLLRIVDKNNNNVFLFDKFGDILLNNNLDAIWSSLNDGVDSGLDADLFDGHESSEFATLDNSNTFTANQTAPYFIQSEQYNPNNPRPIGFPQTNANALDEEFNGSFAHSFQVYDSGSATTNFDKAGYLTITSVTSGKYYYMTDLGSNKLTGDFDVTIHFAQPPFASHIGLALATDESTPKTYVMSLYWGGSSSSFYCSGRNNGWVAGSTAQVYYIYGIQYFRFIRYNGTITAYFSTDGIGWTQSQIRNVETSTTVAYISDSNAIRYYGIYISINGGAGLNCPSHILANAVDWIRWK